MYQCCTFSVIFSLLNVVTFFVQNKRFRTETKRYTKSKSCFFTVFEEMKNMHESFIETTNITSYWQFLRMVTFTSYQSPRILHCFIDQMVRTMAHRTRWFSYYLFIDYHFNSETLEYSSRDFSRTAYV